MPETTAFCYSKQLLRAYSGEKSGLNPLLEKSNMTTRVISTEDQDSIIAQLQAAPRGREYANAFLIAIETGIRTGELKSLLGNQVDVDRSMVSIAQVA